MSIATIPQYETLVGSDTVLTEVLDGLSQMPKRLPHKLFYDTCGSDLFERICEQPEYYITRTELDILRANAEEIASYFDSGCTLLELGSGASTKTRVLLDAMRGRCHWYAPVDISASALTQSVASLSAEYPNLHIEPLCADYVEALEVRIPADSGGVVAFFPGSTIGNFEPSESVTFLKRIRNICGRKMFLLIGIDLLKAPHLLEAAYNDAAGVTAKFNLNILRVLNRDYGAGFGLDKFRHQAVWNDRANRIEMQLVSRLGHAVWVASRYVRIKKDEPIITEHCYKYSLLGFQAICKQAGFEAVRTFQDPQRLFSILLLHTV